MTYNLCTLTCAIVTRDHVLIQGQVNKFLVFVTSDLIKWPVTNFFFEFVTVIYAF